MTTDAKLKYLQQVIQKELNEIPAQEKTAVDEQKGFAKERPRNYYRGATESYKYVLALVEELLAQS